MDQNDSASVNPNVTLVAREFEREENSRITETPPRIEIPFIVTHARVAGFLFLNLHGTGSTIGGIFWGLWLVPYGLLVFKSGLFPRIIGVLLIIECFGFLIQSFAGFLWPNLEANLALLPALTSWAELLLPLWLLIKGVNVEQWKKRALESV